MTYLHLAYFHLATVLPAYLIATFLLLSPKGTRLHKALGRTCLLLLLITATITLLMPAHVGPQLLNHFGWIHLLSLLVLVFAPHAWWAARQGKGAPL